MAESTFIGTEALIERALAACRAAVVISDRELKAKVEEDTPVDTGTLLRTTRIWGPYGNGLTVIGRVIQGGQGTKPDGERVGYAIIVHQKWSHRGPARQVKVPLIEHRARHVELLAAAGREEF